MNRILNACPCCGESRSGHMCRCDLDYFQCMAELYAAHERWLADRLVEIVADEFAIRGNQVLVWTVFDEESRILFRKLRDLSGCMVAILDGETRADDRANIIADYKAGLIDVLISKASLLGFALNLQNTGAMVFSGWDDSYERFYQAVRRAVRYGQLKHVRIHLPFIPELEGHTYENRKVAVSHYRRKRHPWYDGGNKTQEQAARDERPLVLSRSVRDGVT